MFAKIVWQNGKIKKKFEDKIELYNIKNPSNIDKKELKRRKRQGKFGEVRVGTELWAFLPSKYIVLNDIALEVRPNIFTQIDHLVLSPQGIYVIETKTWKGKFNNNINNEWEFVKDNKTFKAFTDPVAQNKYHVNMLKEWLKENFEFYNEVKDFIFSMTILNKGEIIKNYGDARLASGGFSAAIKIKHEVGKNISYEVLNKLANAIKKAKELEHWQWIHEHFKIADTREVTIKGSKEEALKVVQIYKARGFEISYLEEIGDDKNKWSFKVLNHVKYVDEYINKETKYIRSSESFTRKSLEKALSPRFIRSVVITIIILSFITLNGSKIENKFFTIFSSLNKSIAAMSHTSTAESNVKEETENDETVMTFKVKDKYSYVFIKDGENTVIEKLKFRKGSEIIFYKNKTILIKDIEQGETEYKVDNNLIKFEVGNLNTEILHRDESIDIRSRVLKYDFEKDEIFK